MSLQETSELYSLIVHEAVYETKMTSEQELVRSVSAPDAYFTICSNSLNSELVCWI